MRETQCLVTSWLPESNSAFVGETVVQTSNCRTTREVPGTRVREAQCLVTSWLPESNSAFVGETVAQTSNCGTTREVPGTREPPVQCDSRFDLGGLDPADFFTDQCAVFYNKCEQSTTICGLKPDPKPVRCMIIPATFEVVLHFVYVGGSEDFAEYVSGTSTNDLISNANRVINSYTSGGAIELLYSVDNSVSAITVCE